jgi:hypothetical protein
MASSGGMADRLDYLELSRQPGCDLRHRVADTVVDEMPTA